MRGKNLKTHRKLGALALTCNPSTWEVGDRGTAHHPGLPDSLPQQNRKHHIDTRVLCMQCRPPWESVRESAASR